MSNFIKIKLNFSLMLLLFIVTLISACSGSDDRKAQYVDRAQQYFIAGDLDNANIEIKSALQIDPENISSWYLFAQISEKKEELKEAFAAYHRVIELDPTHVDASLELARFYVLGNRHTQSKKHLDVVLAAEPNKTLGKVLEAEVMAREGEEREALARLEKIFADDKTQARAAQLIAVLYARHNKIHHAEKILNIAIEVNPENTAIRLTLADILFKAARPQDTERLLKELVMLEPGKFIHRTRLATFYVNLNRFDDAEQVLRDAIEENRDEAARSLLLAEFIVRQGSDVVEEELKAQIIVQPKAYELQFVLAKLYELNKDGLSAKNIYEQIIAVDNEHPRAVSAKRKFAAIKEVQDDIAPVSVSLVEVIKHSLDDTAELFDHGKEALTQGLFNEALAANSQDTLVSLKEYKTVLSELAELFKVAPDHAEEHKKNRLLHAAKEKRDAAQQAESLIDEPLNMNSNDLKAIEELVKLYLFQDKRSAAIKLVEQKIKNYPDSSALYARLGSIYAVDNTKDKKIFEKVQENYQKAIKLKPEWQTPYLQLADLYRLYKEDKAAEQLYQQGLKAIPDDIGLQISLAGLYESQENYNEAKKLYERVLDKNSNQLIARNNLAVILSHSNATADNLVKALELAQPFAQAKNPLLLDTLGWVYYKNKDYKQALFYLAQAAEKQPKNATIQYHLGMAYYKVSNNKLAKKYLERSLALDKKLKNEDKVQMVLAEI